MLLIQSGTFCYPIIIISGYMKCSTSALHTLLSQYPNIAKETSMGKENCLVANKDGVPHFDYAFPTSVGVNEWIVSGCITPEENIKARIMLRQPNTFYLVRK